MEDFMLDLALTPRTRKTLLMAAGLVVLAAVVLFSFGPFSVGSIEARLAVGAREALDSRGHDWASVRMDGQRAILTGAAPDVEARDDAIATVLTSSWSGGVVAGGVTRVRSADDLPGDLALMIDCAGHAALAQHGPAILSRGSYRH